MLLGLHACTSAPLTELSVIFQLFEHIQDSGFCVGLVSGLPPVEFVF